jgi:hypothetical protein
MFRRILALLLFASFVLPVTVASSGCGSDNKAEIPKDLNQPLPPKPQAGGGGGGGGARGAAKQGERPSQKAE